MTVQRTMHEDSKCVEVCKFSHTDFSYAIKLKKVGISPIK